MKERDLDEKQLKMYKSMKMEIEAKFKNINAGAYQSQFRNMDSVKLFARVMIVAFRKSNLNRVRNKHIQYFADYMKSNGYSNATITTNLAGIRYFYNQVSDGRQYIPTNRELGVKPRTRAERINVNRAMPRKQYEELKEIALKQGRMDFYLQLKLGYLFGLRIHEIVGIRKSKIRAAKRRFEHSNDSTGSIEVKGKNGLIRFVEVRTDQQWKLLEDVLVFGEGKDDRVFVETRAMHLVIKDFQRFVRENRDPNGEYAVTPHSLRHSYCQNEYQRHGDRAKIAASTGHKRISISAIYLDSVEDWNEVQ